jgi:hypothetical protein
MLGDFIKNNKLVFTIITILVLGLLAYGLFIAISRSGKEPVEVHLVPDNAVLTANGEQIGQGTAYLKPGDYTIEAKRDGFREHKDTIHVDSPNKAVIDIALTPESEEAKQWASEHQDLYYAYEGRTAERANRKGEDFSKVNPIASKIPFENFLYTIGYRADPDDPTGDSIIIEIDAMPGYRKAALDKIRELGYDPTDYKINFRNYESPFDHE